MMSWRHYQLARLANILLLSGFCTTAKANVPLPTVFAFGLPFWNSCTVFVGLLIGIVMLEALTLKLIFKRPMFNAVGITGLANVVSTTVGALVPLKPLGLLLIVGIISLAGRFGYQLSTARRWGLVLGVIALIVGLSTPWGGPPVLVEQIYAVLLGAFLLTIIVEGGILAVYTKQPGRGLRLSLAMNCASYLLLAGLLYTSGFRSGAVISREFLLFFSLRKESNNRERALDRTEEIYAWLAAGSEFNRTLRRKEESAWYELNVARSWAEQGHTTDAQRLVQLVEDNREISAPDPQQLQAARDAITKGMTPH